LVERCGGDALQKAITSVVLPASSCGCTGGPVNQVPAQVGLALSAQALAALGGLSRARPGRSP
jgi:predicted hotdog family 3-hydroxylacyl-ACP dehydratase